MRRRDLLGTAAVLAFSRGAAATAASTNARIGFIVTGEAFPRHYFDEALRRLGWVEGSNLTVDRRVTGEDPDRRKRAAAELVAERPDVIVAAGVFDARPVFTATRAIPIVVITGADLIENGLVQSLSHPGTNVTGTTVLGGELDGKRLELLHELVPSATRIAAFGRKTDRYTARMSALEDVARQLGLNISRRLADDLPEMETAYQATADAGDQAVVQMASPLAFENQPRIIALAARLRLPVIYEAREYAEHGGLISYGQVWAENFERSASLVDKILKGANPSDLPVERPTKFEVVINMRTAKALGLNPPQSVLARADEVIE
jgi:putative tryptophan/tyrosine transport system substrate-binding protein